jgi:lipopolysaccharide transport system ATP-binding protein
MTTVIKVEELSKAYRLGQIDTRVLAYDLNIWWAKIQGKPNPMLKIGQEDHGNRIGETIWALKDVSFNVSQGDVLGIIGRNGAGKSTLLKVLSRVTAPTSGRIKVKGRIASLLEVGTGFHPDLTGRENIFLNGSILGMSKKEIRRKFDEIVDFAEIEQFIDTPVKRYSSGMYVRLAFAVAAHLEPEILVVDEVLAVGDAAFQQKCLGKMGEVAHAGKTVLFVSHNMGAVRRLCQNGIVLDKGKITYHGSIEDSVDSYLAQNYQQMSWENGMVSYGNFPLKIETIKILDNQGNENCRFKIGSKVAIELVTSVKKTISSSHIHVLVKYNGSVLFRTFDTDSHPEILLQRLAGNYKTVVVIDTLWLKPGRYDISIDCGIRPSMLFEKGEDILFFELFDPDGDFDKGWSIHRQGIIRAPVYWKINDLNRKIMNESE